MVDKRVNEIAKKIMPLYVVEGLFLDMQNTQDNMAKMIVEALPQERESLRTELSTQINNVVSNFIPSQFEKPATTTAPCRLAVVRTRYHEDHHDDDARPEGENNAKRQNTSEHGTYSVVPTEEVSQELLKEISGEIDVA
ncbi:hypothetical protein Tco_0561797 [Tanacetum coccineum]